MEMIKEFLKNNKWVIVIIVVVLLVIIALIINAVIKNKRKHLNSNKELTNDDLAFAMSKVIEDNPELQNLDVKK